MNQTPPRQESNPDKRIVLVVDDEPAKLKVLSHVLQSQYLVRVARSGEQALKAIDSEPRPDLILLDIMMPEMDGYTVLQQLNEHFSDRNIPVIFVTALSNTEDEARGLELGAVDYITKPIRPAIVLARVHTQLELKSARDALQELNRDLESQVRIRTAQLRTALDQTSEAHAELRTTFKETLTAFSQLIESKGGLIKGHSKRVANDARKLAHALTLDNKQIQDILFAGLLLQTGKITLPEKLLERPLETLGKDEQKRYFNHAQVGQSVLKNIKELEQSALLVGCQYEHYDGSGQPNRLAGDQIPIGAQILAIVRDYELVQEGHLIGKRLGVNEAQDFLLKRKERHYNPELVDRFLQLKGRVIPHKHRLVVDASLLDLVPGMEIAEVSYEGQTYLKNQVLTDVMIKQIEAMQMEVGPFLQIRVRVRDIGQ